MTPAYSLYKTLILVQIIRNLNNFSQKLPQLALTIGNFDGVHLGHVAIINKVKKIAKAENLKSALLTFEPHPNVFFNPKLKESFRIQTLSQKLKILQQLQLDYLIILPFDQHSANCSAEEFISKYLVSSLNLKHLAIGYDFIFGKSRQGNFQLLEERSHQYGYKVTRVEEVKSGDQTHSSSKIRSLISYGKIQEANLLLGRNFSISGDVICGKKIARQIGFPTANVKPKKSIILPKFGVYKAFVNIAHLQKKILAIVNFGIKPTFQEDPKPLFEAHIFDYDQEKYGELYGKKIEIEFTNFIREEKKFASVNDLKNQIKADCLALEDF